jgi:serine/threonine protein kinase
MTVSPTPPETLREALADRYQLQREIGRGGMATVYLAMDLKHNREVAVKVLRPELAASLGADRFLREIEIAAQLNHPHILPLLDSAELDGALLYVMPFVDGESLRALLEREGPLPLDRAMTIATEVARALTYAHRRGVVHRDIKPENILLSDGHAVVADFGIAKALSSIGGQELTRTGFPIGTPGYMSPEQAAGIADLDARSDVFSLACVVYEMLVGDAPRFWLSEEAIREGRVIDAPAKHRSRLDALPPEVERALVRALTLKPQDRMASPTEFAGALTERQSGSRRRYSDTQVQDIVKRASEAEAQPTRDGMTIGGVQQLGAEVGIAPEIMAQAAKSLGTEPKPALSTKVLGSPEKYYMQDDIPGVLDPTERADLINRIRELMGDGEVNEVMGSLEWRGGDDINRVTVTITPRQDDVRVTVMANRDVAGMLSYFFPMLAGVVVAALIGDAIRPPVLGVIALFGTGITTGWVVGRTIFVTTGNRLKRKLDSLRWGIRGYLERGGR